MIFRCTIFLLGQGCFVIFALSFVNIIIITTMIIIYRCTIFLHGVGHLVVLVSSSLARKEAFLAHVKVETLQATVPGKVLLMKRPIMVIIIFMIMIVTKKNYKPRTLNIP